MSNLKHLVLLPLTFIATTAYSAPVPIDSSVLTKNSKSDNHYGIGATISVAQRPFIGVDDQTTSLPYLSFRYKDFYVEGTNVGYKFVNQSKHKLDFLLTPRYYEVQETFADNGELDGIRKTKQTYFAGLSYQFQTKFATYTAQVLKDVVESDGTELVATASKTFTASKFVKIAPTIGLTWQDNALIDHFYGVRSNEVVTNRPQYSGESSLNYFASLTSAWNVTQHVQLLAQLEYEVLGDGITKSVISDQANSQKIIVNHNHAQNSF